MNVLRMSVQIDDNLRKLIHATRTNPSRWPGGRLTQEEMAVKVGCTPTWYRKIENGKAPSASVATICDICQVLGIDPAALRVLGYDVVAAELAVRRETGSQVVVDLDDLGGLTAEERQALAIILAKLGFDGGWRQKGRRAFNDTAERVSA